MFSEHNHSILKNPDDSFPHDENRHVHFDKMKEVQIYDPTTGSMIAATPTKEKAFETVSSEGTPSSYMDVVEDSDDSLNKTKNVSHESIQEETLDIFDISEEFKLPTFDPEVVKTIFFAEEDFQNLLKSEMAASQKEMEKSYAESDGAYHDRLKFLKSNSISELTKIEQKVIQVAYKKAEIRFLELRLKFAAEKRVKSEKTIFELQKVQKSRNSIPEMFDRVQDEYFEAKKEIMRIRLEKIQKSYKEQLDSERKRFQLRLEIEERRKKLERLEMKENESKERMEQLISEMEV
ncbi:hypothetical protein L5515_004897 [Caenorhabditis briggsae]|uniref:Uncharacterized protein n=1 Tax=Caenorhabditis briggsae TaxID=6238 RepID=A0AAE9EIW4_CAEBR|nr:hypothetical protein L5515_004897 [Caenorhabditis briggsae]